MIKTPHPKYNHRADHKAGHRSEYERNRQIILKTQDICGICGQPVDKTLKYPDPMSATVDHIIPINRGGHPSSIDNLQLAHFRCNRLKSDNFMRQRNTDAEVLGNRNLPLSMDWMQYRADDEASNQRLTAEVAKLNKSGLVLTSEGVMHREDLSSR